MRIVHAIPLLLVVLGCHVVPVSRASEGDTTTNGTTDVDLNYLSIRGNIYSASPKRLGTDGWGAKISVRASMGIHRFETLDDLLHLNKDNVATFGIEPKLILAYPVPYLDDVNISPRASIEATSKHYLGFSLGKYKFVIHPHAKYGYYFESLVLETPDGDPLTVRSETEIGAKIQTDPRWRIWKLKMPRIKISYTFGDGIQGLKIKLST